jgi:hypothetical protein
MKPTTSKPKGDCFEVNWASQLLREKGYSIYPPEVWSDGTMRWGVNDVPMTKRQVICTAAQHPEWRHRTRLYLDHLNDYQRSLAVSAH